MVHSFSKIETSGAPFAAIWTIIVESLTEQALLLEQRNFLEFAVLSVMVRMCHLYRTSEQ